MEFEIITLPNDTYKCVAIMDETDVCKCQISVQGSTWSISTWFTKEEYKHRGIGRKTMQQLMHFLYYKYNHPESIEYIWNGANQYVYEWIHSNFDAYCKTPLAVQKYAFDDSWDSHIYVLNVDKIFDFFEIRIFD